MALTAKLIQNSFLNADLLAVVRAGTDSSDVLSYEGAYFFVPSDHQQVINTKGKLMGENVVIDKVPSNYGLIEYDGFQVRIS